MPHQHCWLFRFDTGSTLIRYGKKYLSPLNTCGQRLRVVEGCSFSVHNIKIVCLTKTTNWKVSISWKQLILSIPWSGGRPKLSPSAERTSVWMVRKLPGTTKERNSYELEADETPLSLLFTVKQVVHRSGLKGCCQRNKPLLMFR